MNKLACVFTVLFLGTACSANGGTGSGVDPDASAANDATPTDDTPSGTGDAPHFDATPPPADTTTPPADTTTPPADRVTPPADRPPPADATPAGDFGACGEDTHNAICMCGMNATCQQTALGNALTTNTDCATCYANAIAGCCPAQAMAVQTCAQDAGCTDQACAQRMCATQFMALQTCVQTGQTSVAACQMRFGLCFGSAFPMIDCGG